MTETRSRFIRVRCKDCGNEQVLFDRASRTVTCHICGAVLAKPRGGKAEIRGEVLEVLE
ncbi:MAG: 30S ribosomal protein S27e [Thermoplasmata archaeon]|nr:MAG: 30S ribosomal protein S27e [Thermoplasmata archaeon]